MALESLHLNDFGVFEDVTFEFCPGLNVIIGENATGKSHAMKAAYAMLRALQSDRSESRATMAASLAFRLQAVFRPKDGDIGRLMRSNAGDRKAGIEIFVGDMHMDSYWDRESDFPMVVMQGPTPSSSAVYVPSREVLAMYEGFVAAYDARELSFDETYYDLCKLLSATPLRGERAERAKELLEPLREALGGEVRSADGRFYVEQGSVELEAHLVAEGLRKIASIYHLINTGGLTQDGILFWDEPEASLNPRLTERVAKFLVALVGSGVQVVIASHDYLLTHRLSLLAEYGKLPEGATMRFFSLSRPQPGAPVEVEAGDTLVDLEHNSILDEFARFYDDEQALALADD
ncbi:AAA family ATPase [Paraliomyxa miuraensis]|uniref:AAA family ATPase n=1 Tax=Paraliomyxa miuraensis TaxID=376150 RepID=UPI002259F176|nr:AAA family ATPase [Paraliomyxa miuraensis]MCX4239825.1 AAA family ATPase [Paraliomyxa miuraensis]